MKRNDEKERGIGTMNSLCVYVVEQGHLVKSMETGDSIVSSNLHVNSLCVYVVAVPGMRLDCVSVIKGSQSCH